MSKLNYKLEGDINFYDELYKSLDEDTKEETDNSKVCQITGLPLKDNYVTLKCKHVFNYDAIYTEVCKQKFEFKTYINETLSLNDFKMLKEKHCDYYIKCPYCRSIQIELLPYYENTPFIKRYGVNTSDISYRVVDNTSHINQQLYNTGSYTYKVYGYTFKKGVCSKINVTTNGKSIPCYNSFVSNIDGLEKSYCPCHIRQAAKEYTLIIKAKIKEEKLKQKEEKLKQKILLKAINEEKQKQKVLQKAIDKATTTHQKNKVMAENVVVSQTNDIGVFVSDSSPQLCIAILKTGLRKGQECGLNGYNGHNMCKRHSK
jgi:hypothetical protein